jgi:hypothetical protein
MPCCNNAVCVLFTLWAKSGFRASTVAAYLTFFPPNPSFYQFKEVPVDERDAKDRSPNDAEDATAVKEYTYTLDPELCYPKHRASTAVKLTTSKGNSIGVIVYRPDKSNTSSSSAAASPMKNFLLKQNQARHNETGSSSNSSSPSVPPIKTIIYSVSKNKGHSRGSKNKHVSSSCSRSHSLSSLISLSSFSSHLFYSTGMRLT